MIGHLTTKHKHLTRIYKSSLGPMVKSILAGADRKRRPRQSVSFHEQEAQVVLEVDSCFDFADHVRQALWHTRNDYQFSRSSARVIAKESERYGHSRHLDGVYLTNYDQQVQDSLNLWCLHGNTRRGLERWANAVHGQERKDDQYVYIQGVLRAQAEMRLRDDYSDERLREVGHVLSRKSRLFAQMMGRADSHAAQWEFGMIDMLDARAAVSPRQRRKNLGLSGKVSRASSHAPSSPPVRVSASATATTAVRRSPETRAVTPKITIRTRPGRVPRMA